MDVAFNINRLALVGLGATLTSLIRNCSNSKELKLWFLCSNLREKDKVNIGKLLQSELFEGTIQYVDFEEKATFGHLPSLHGNWTAYGRLLIPKYINAASCLYLDADIIVLLDVLSIRDFQFNGNILAATFGSTIADVLDKQFFIKCLNWNQEKPYFNSGVVLFNIKSWLEHNVDTKWMDLANKYSADLISHDQTILNAVCGGTFSRLSSTFNNAWLPVEEKPQDHSHSILHFVGSPKPWDFFGSVLHKGYNTWRSYNNKDWDKTYNRLSFQKIARNWIIRRSIIRNALKMRAISLNKHNISATLS